MSIEAMQWAFNQDIKPSSVKFVLVSLGDNAQHDGLAWPSLKALCAKTGQDRKTVIAALDKLEVSGFLSDSGKRTGRTHQVKVYQFNFNRSNDTGKGTVDEISGKSTGNGTIPETEQFRNSQERVPKTDGNSTVFPAKSTENGTRNPQEPTEPKSKPKVGGRAADDDFDPIKFLTSAGVSKKVAKDWLALRRKKNLPPTETAFEGVVREAAVAKMSLSDAVRMCCERGWGGFMAKWLVAEPARVGGTSARSDPNAGKEWWEHVDGINAKGKALKIAPQGKDEIFANYRNRVYVAAGEGAWMEWLRKDEAKWNKS